MASHSIHLSSAKIDDVLSNIHVTGCQPSQIESIMDVSWDMSHLPATIGKIFVDNPNHTAYLYATPSCCDTTGASGKEAPVLTAIVLPQTYGPPTVTALRYNNQRASEELIPFGSLGYIWKEVTDEPSLKGRLIYLACEADLENISDTADIVYALEYSTPYLVSGKELRTNRYGNLWLDYVNFTYEDCDGDLIQGAEWDCSVNLEDFVNDLYHSDDYQPMDEDVVVDEAASKAYLRKVISEAAQLKRVKKEADHLSHFKSVNYTRRQVNKIKCYVILPVNYPASIQSKPIYSWRCVDAFLQQQQGGPIYVADHYSLSGAGLRSRLPSNVLSSFDTEKDRLHMTLILDFADAIRHKVNTTAALDALVQNYEARILQYIGSNLNRLIDKCKEMISKVGRWPYDARDFILNFLFNAPRTRNLRTLLQEQPQSIRVNSSGVLEVKCFGGRGYKRISTAGLREILSKEGIISSILPLLCGAGEAIVLIPAGAREDHDDAQVNALPAEQQLRRDCFKASLLLLPTLRGGCKHRIERYLPDHEVPFHQISELLEQRVKTVVMKKVRIEIHQTAMTAACMMVGVFYVDGGNQQHCVFIDGSDGAAGSISDPLPEYEKRMTRCENTLKVLGITEFSSLFIVKSVDVNQKTMRKLKKDH